MGSVTWRATVHEAAKSQKRLSEYTQHMTLKSTI